MTVTVVHPTKDVRGGDPSGPGIDEDGWNECPWLYTSIHQQE
jgi:hypothetical protein